MMKSDMHERKSDKCLVFKLWEQIGPYWQIGTGLLLAIYVSVSWINGVQASQKEIDNNNRRIIALEEKYPDMNSDIKVVKQRVDDIANYIGVPKRRQN